VNTNSSIPPSRDLPPGRLSERQQHLLAEITSGPKRRRVRPSLPLPRLRATALAGGLATALLLGTVALLATRAGTETASAADVRAKISEALSSTQSLRGEYTVRTQASTPVRRRHGCLNCRPVAPVPSRFVIGTDGSYAQVTLPIDANPRSDVAYDASTGVQTSIMDWGGATKLRLYLTATHLDPAWPGYSPEAQLAAWVRQALAVGNPRIENASFDGRSAWKLTLRFTPGDDFFDTYGARVDVVVDQATGLVLQVTQYADSPDRWTSIESIHDLKVGTPTTPADFELAKPDGARAISHDYGFRRVPVATAAEVVRYRPLLPTYTGGRPLVDLAVAKFSSWRLLPEMTAPVFREVVSARYGHGPTSFTVSTRRGPVGDAVLGLTGHTLTLTGGALAGDTAWLSTTPPEPGLLSAYHHGLVVQVHAFSGREALAVANSLTASQ
jgi:hypothetical protein